MTTIYPIIPGGPSPFYIMIPVVVILLGAFLLLAWTLYGSQRARVELSPAGLSFRGDVWGRKPIPLSRIRVREARVVDLGSAPELQPTRRRMGTGLPGYASGWFRLRSGEKALIYLTDRRRVVYLPTDLGYSVLASVTNPDALLSELQALAAR